MKSYHNSIIRNKVIYLITIIFLLFTASNTYAIPEIEKYETFSKTKKELITARRDSVVLPQQGSSKEIASYDLLFSSSKSPKSLQVSSTADGFTATPLVLHNSSANNLPFGNHFYHNGWDKRLNSEKYYEMTITGTKYVLDRLDFSLEQINAEPSRYFITTSLDNFQSITTSGRFANGDVTSFSTKSLSKLGVITGDISLRFYLTTTDNQLSGFANHECKPDGSDLFDAGCGLPDLGSDIILYGWKSDENPITEPPVEPEIESKSVLNKNLPTIVLIHGLSNKDDTKDDLWTGFKDHQAGGLILSDLGQNTVNVIQYVWRDAFTSGTTPTQSAYTKARNATSNAGMHLSKALLEELGTTYNEKLHFIGHSLGTIVSTYAIKNYISENSSITNIQFTSLDRPDRVTAILGISDEEEKTLGFNEDFFYLNIFKNKTRNDLNILLDNYYSFSGLGGVGDIASTGDTKTKILNQELTSPNDVDTELNIEEGIQNDHSGVHQWYRWTMNPNNFPTKMKDYCDGFKFDKPFFMARDLSPCETGWKSSINKNNIIGVLSDNDGGTINSFSTVAEMNAYVGSDCELTENVFTCQAKTISGRLAKNSAAKNIIDAPFGTSVINIPVGTTNITFDYQFNDMEDNDYATVLIGNQEIWKILGSSVLNESQYYQSGFLPLNIGSGDHLLTISLNDINNQNAEMKIKNIVFHSNISSSDNITGVSDDGVGDNVDNNIEFLVPNVSGNGLGDGNGDNSQDALQNNVASLQISDSSNFVTLDSTLTTDVLNSSVLTNVNTLEAPSDGPDGLIFPYGLISFTVNEMNPGGVAKLALFYPRNPDIIGFYKKDINGNWADIAQSITFEPNKTKIEIEIEDGGIYDLDGLINGSVTDPSGPVINANPLVPDAESIPTNSFYGLLLLSIMLSFFGIRNRKGNIKKTSIIFRS